MVWAVPRSLAATSGITTCFLFLEVLRWFTSLRCLRSAYGFGGGSFGISRRGLPHSEIPGSKLVCSLPGLIAAYRVLHRLLAPRHSPYALSSLTIRNSNLRWPGFWLQASGFSTFVPEPGARSLTRVSFMHTACVWSEKLPFAGYSVVKDHSGGNIAPRISFGGRGALSPGPPSLSRSRGPHDPRSAPAGRAFRRA